MKNTYIIIVMMILLINSSAHSQKKLWDSFYDGYLVGKDEAFSVITDLSGNVYITGISYHFFEGGDFTTVKFADNGSRLWADHFSHTQASYSNYGIRLAMDKWQNVYAIGSTALNDSDPAIFKYNADGRIWAKNYETAVSGSGSDFGVDIDVDSSGNFYSIARVTSTNGNLYEMYIMKCDTSGSIIWDINYSGVNGDNYPVAIDVTPGGTAYVLLQSFDFYGSATYDISTIKYLSSGVQNWFSSYNGAANSHDFPTSIKVDADENQYVCGTTDAGGSNDIVVMKQNNRGTRLWTVTYNGAANGNDTAVAATWLPNGSTVVTGNSKEMLNSNRVDAIVTLIIDNGIIIRTNKFYGTGNLGALASEMITDALGNIYICGFEILNDGTKNGCIIKYDINGNLFWNVSYDAGINLDDKFNSIALDHNGQIAVTGQTFLDDANASFLTVKYWNGTVGVSSNPNIVKDFYLHQNYPNPFNPVTNLEFEISKLGFVSLKVYSIVGKEVTTLVNENLNPGTYKYDFDGSNLTSGIYFYTLNVNGFSATKKMLMIK